MLFLSQNLWDKSTNMSQILVFSNNMEYDRNDTVEPLQGAYYAASSYQEAKFNFFREEDDYAGFPLDDLNDGQILESDFELTLANPYFIKQLPGRKSDVKDAQWIAECLQKELIRSSFVAGDVLQQMRQYTR
ncbi:hypothetical protein FACS189426_05040 [Bacteroidia bacterium]|nr:hypothetical protein FACS189426_05040 [Bacteroidia bacterium]